MPLIKVIHVRQGPKGVQGDPATNLVTSVAGRQGAVVLNKSDVGLGNVDNTSDANKPVSTAQAAADTAVANAASTALGTHTARTDNPHAVTKAQVGLGNVDNTSDANKPVSTAQAAADTAVANAASAALGTHTARTDNPHAVTKAQVGLGNVENTALSTWAGSANITTLGTVNSGTWNGTAIADAYIASAATWNAKQAALVSGTSIKTVGGVSLLGSGDVLNPTFGSVTATGSLIGLDVSADAYKSTASRVIGVTSSGNFANSDNGKYTSVTGTAIVTRTVVSGLTSGFTTELANNTTGTGALLLAASGVTLNGSTASIRIERGSKARIEYLSSNAYAVTITPQGSPRIELANMMPTPLAWTTATATANTANTFNYFSWIATLNNGTAVAGNYVLFPLADCPLTRPGSGANMRLNGSRLAFLTDLFCNGFSNSEIRVLLGVATGVTSLAAAGLGVVFTGYQTAKLQIHDGTTLTESAPFSIGDFDIGRINRFLISWDGETGTLGLYQENHVAQGRPNRFALKGSVTATPPTTGSGDSSQVVLYATGTPGFNVVLRQRGSYWFNDLTTP